MRVVATIDQREITQLIRKFEKLRSNVDPKKELRKVFIKAAQPVVSALQKNAPYKDGYLRKSIGVIPYLGSRTGRVFIGVKKDRVIKKVTAFYALFLEFGTKYIRRGKFSFFEKSVSQSIDQVKAIILNSLRLKIQNAASAI